MSKKLILPLTLVAITLVFMWFFVQSTFTSVTVHLPLIVATPTHIVQHHHKTK